MFKVGDFAVYPAQGIGVIESIESRDFGGQAHDFYVLRLIDSDMTIMIPTANVEHVGMRTPVCKERLSKVYDILQIEKVEGKLASWSRRQREYTEKIKTGDLQEVAAVLRELYHLKGHKELSYGEKKFLDQARRLLVMEIAAVEGAQEDVVEQRLENLFH
ncbi:MAG: CarD family transcriptional regulator [Desulfuromonadales bacterium]